MKPPSELADTKPDDVEEAYKYGYEAGHKAALQWRTGTPPIDKLCVVLTNADSIYLASFDGDDWHSEGRISPSRWGKRWIVLPNNEAGDE